MFILKLITQFLRVYILLLISCPTYTYITKIKKNQQIGNILDYLI